MLPSFLASRWFFQSLRLVKATARPLVACYRARRGWGSSFWFLFINNKAEETIKAPVASLEIEIVIIVPMNYDIAKLSEVNPEFATELKNHCYTVVGLCQQVHRELGPFLNEYMYQEALDISLEENNIARVKEYYFSVIYHGRQIKHKHYVDFLVNNDILVECKAIERLGSEQRQQLWNYMRLTKVCIGLLFNFAPVHDQCERYYLDKTTGNMYMF